APVRWIRRTLTLRFDEPMRWSVLTGADMRNRLDLDLQRGIRQGRHLHQGRGRKVAGEALPPGPPYLLALADVGDEDGHLDDVRHAAACRLNQMADLAEDRFRLGIFVGGDARLVRAARGHPGQIGDAVDDQAVRPGARRRFADLWADGADDAAHISLPGSH